MFEYDVIVVGGGQAGLAVGHYLQQEGLRFVILEKQARVGASWRNRYDSLVLFTPRRYCDLPGFPFPGDRDGLPSKDDAANYLEAYADHFGLPVRLQTEVTAVEKTGTGFLVRTTREILQARSVVIATGPFHTPFLPDLREQAAREVVQLHTADYKNERQLRNGSVLVVGAGNSGAQIAAELAAERTVYLSMGQSRSFLPLSLLGKNIFWYLRASGLLAIPVTSWLGKRLSEKPDPIFGYRRQLIRLERAGQLRMVPRTVSLSGTTARFADGTEVTVDNILWATGFRSRYDWLRIPDALDGEGRPLHRRGVSPVHGLFFIGLPWQHTRSSALMGGVGADAKQLMKQMKAIL